MWNRTIPTLSIVFAVLGAPACAQNGFDQPDGPLRLEVAYPNLSFTRPVDFQTPRDGSNRIFVVEQQGIIRVFENLGSVSDAPVFLDIRDRVNDSGNEEGLLGLAFHPDFQNNRVFFVDYTASDPRRTVIARYTVDPDEPDRALRDSEEVVLEVAQPYSNHNAGQIVFGPEGYLYVTLGDGGSGGDPQENGQDPTTLLGSILRIDVDGTEDGHTYAIPADNPFVGNTDGTREEIFAYGLRNPWRISFDPETNRLWVADVGQNAYEEVDIVESGKNYGWDIVEGLHCFEPRTDCNRNGLVPPVWEYPHSEGSSITGGFVYRGEDAPPLVGRYVYGDYVSGKLWALSYDGQEAENEELMDTNLGISSFGVDADGELYVLAFDGKIYRFTVQSQGAE